MSAIDKIILRNFKAFNDTTEIILDGNHLLMFGENGSGKSSIYWALYTLLQGTNKSQSDISKYFTPNNQENLINQTYLKNRPDFAIDADGLIIEPTSIGLNASVEVILENKAKLVINSIGFNGID
jgi:recombinational DNA repair ATPase RecF